MPDTVQVMIPLSEAQQRVLDGVAPLAPVQIACNRAAGLVLAEIFDADGPGAPVRLINGSTLGFVGPAENALSAGFVIAGTGTKRLLVRAVGPGLAGLGVPGLLADPQLAVHALDAASALASNNDWAGTAELKAAATAAGAYDVIATNALGTATSAPATLTVTVRDFTGTYAGRLSGGTEGFLLVRTDGTAALLAPRACRRDEAEHGHESSASKSSAASSESASAEASSSSSLSSSSSSASSSSASALS